MEKKPVVSVLIAAVIYAVMFVLGSTCGLIHPACYAYAGTVIPLLFGFVYLYTAARWQGFGAAAILNGVVLVIGLIAGEGNLAMVIGLLPMMFASGVGKNGNQTLGAAAVGGMMIGTLLQVLIVPALFVIFQSLQEKIRPMVFNDEMNEEAAAELQQYAHGKPEEYELEV